MSHRGAARVLTAALRARFPAAIESVLLRGSLTMGLSVPGLSDIDLFVILRDEVGPEEHLRIKDLYGRTAAWLRVLDPHPWVLRWCEVEKLYRENPSLRFRVMEGRQVFESLYGANRLRQLPAPAPLEAALAQLSDLKSRLTYFNAFCLTRTFTDELEARRKEYMLFKLTLDLARIALFLSSGESVFHRAEILRRLTEAETGGSSFRGLESDEAWRDFIVHTARFRLRRSFCRIRGVALEILEEKVLRSCLDLLAAFHRRPSIRECPDLALEPEHFYAGDRFLPADHAVRFVSSESLADYPALKERVLAGNDEGLDTVLQTSGLWINLSNADPRLGNCTVVWQRSVG
jgi:hypothetical protein